MYPLYLAPHLGRGQTLSESGRNHCAVAPSAEGKTRCRCSAVQVILGMWLIWGTPKLFFLSNLPRSVGLLSPANQSVIINLGPCPSWTIVQTAQVPESYSRGSTSEIGRCLDNFWLQPLGLWFGIGSIQSTEFTILILGSLLGSLIWVFTLI